eukprot:TRINITY_DN93041_c0_g1_i1.p1 TRINITY_DN93041_c0_g1~~TRINITY_DN93041_c0_g1_i1.p1  ORF type:complete len:541 (+),score=77.63 TRINITY_DN93041_c0_g1_i1:113-1735(+)
MPKARIDHVSSAATLDPVSVQESKDVFVRLVSGDTSLSEARDAFVRIVSCESEKNAEEQSEGAVRPLDIDSDINGDLPAQARNERPACMIVGLFVGYAYYNTLRGAFPLQMRSIAKELNIPVARIGLPNSVFSAAYGIGKFFGSILTDYLPCAECHTLGILLCGLDVAAVGLCRGITSIAAVWGLQGALQAFGWPFLSRILINKLSKEQCAKYWGILSMAGSMGSMLAPYGTVMASRLGMSWRATLRSFGFSAALVALFVQAMLLRGGATVRRKKAPLTDTPANLSTNAKTEQATQSQTNLLPRIASVLSSPAMLAIFLCNSLSFGASKCTKEWGSMYLRGTQLATSEMQSATLLFWAEIGASVGAALSGVMSLSLGGRHALTCLLSALLGAVSTSILALKSYRWQGQGRSPLPFGVACALQACSLAGINGVRTLAGLHLAEVATHAGAQLGLANGFAEMIGQVGSVLSGLPVGALVARATASRTASGAGAEEAARVGWAAVPALLTLACGSMAALNLALLPQESRRLAHQSRKAENKDQ